MQRHVLAIDDELATLSLLTDVLEEEGYRVTRAMNGRDALYLLPNIQPDLILSDVMMPYVDGIELCRLVRADPRFAMIPIVMLSAYPERQKEAAAQANAFLPKPFSIPSLVDAINHALDHDLPHSPAA